MTQNAVGVSLDRVFLMDLQLVKRARFVATRIHRVARLYAATTIRAISRSVGQLDGQVVATVIWNGDA